MSSVIEIRHEALGSLRIKRLADTAGLSIEECEALVRDGQKFCSKCRQWQPAIPLNFGPSNQTLDGWAAFCRLCANACCRKSYGKRADVLPPGEAAARVTAIDPSLFPPVAHGESIGCLRCRHAKLTTNTGFAPGNTAPIIHCGRAQKEVIIRWHSCPIADPRWAKPKHLHTYYAKWGPIGDKERYASPVLLAFFRAHWSSAPVKQLELVTGWDMGTIAGCVRHHKIGGARTKNNRMHRPGCAHAKRFTQKQSLFILRTHASDDWPPPLVCTLKQPELERRQALQDEFVQDVRSLNPKGLKWTMEQIRCHCQKQMHKRYDLARQISKGQSRRVNQHLSVPIKKLSDIGDNDA